MGGRAAAAGPASASARRAEPFEPCYSVVLPAPRRAAGLRTWGMDRESRDGEGSSDTDALVLHPAEVAVRSSRNAAAVRRQEGSSSNLVIPALSNFSIQYNISAASIALPFLQSHPAFAPPRWVHYVALGVVFAGCMVGMLLLGFLGDLIGRRRAMVVTNAIQVAGALGCALLTWGSSRTMYAIFCFCRLVLGVGVGGMYPLSASHSAEGDDKDMASR